jgi:uncharacterized protein YndB with AHSA1/START domain
MNDASSVHATTVVEHRFAATPAVVFDAWADVDKRGQWDLPGGDDWELVELKQDFRVGGRESARFGPKGAATFWSSGEFLDIVDDMRIVSAGTMHDGDRRTSATMCTVEFFADGTGTRLVLTDQSAFLDGEAPQDRKSGWGKIVVRLGLFLNDPKARH